MPEQSLAQRRAGDALRKIKQITEPEVPEYGNYVAYVQSLPATIITNGLGQALAMQKALGCKEAGVGHRVLGRHIVDWLTCGWETSPYHGKDDILQAIVDGTEDDYLRAQAETMAYLQWLKKFASAYLKKLDELTEPEGDLVEQE